MDKNRLRKTIGFSKENGTLGDIRVVIRVYYLDVVVWLLFRRKELCQEEAVEVDFGVILLERTLYAVLNSSMREM